MRFEPVSLIRCWNFPPLPIGKGNEGKGLRNAFENSLWLRLVDGELQELVLASCDLPKRHEYKLRPKPSPYPLPRGEGKPVFCYCRLNDYLTSQHPGGTNV